MSFLEVNTRLQVEHPVTEEVSGIDLVREMFRIADGQELAYDDPPLRGHSIEFRINAEDPGRGFLPAPGTLTDWHPPSGPGVRLDAGYAAGMTVPQAFDSLIAKLIVTGADRAQALERSRRALAEFEIGGMPTVLPFHRLVVDDPAFTSSRSPCTPGGSRPGSPATCRRTRATRPRGGRRASAGADHGRGRRQAPGGGDPGWARRRRPPGRPPARAPGPGVAPGAGPGETARPRAATRWSAPCRARS